ncbi:hypothetical protein EV384_5011 [Micromonospora kangleipakensis]|uniref:HEAT repeat protein n=2 Tax=Micromonospora kangleipakensis TaxID=1077942 RepID=A0A4Q8BGD1_9ACTN|nr:hypothetical protein EV384_5011 [Micromonospora kangleipakensis]
MLSAPAEFRTAAVAVGVHDADMTSDEAARPATVDEWRAWRRAVFGDPYLVWHDGPEFSRLLRAARADPVMVERMLTAGLDDRDVVAAESLAVLGEAGFAPVRARELLRAAVPTASNTFLVSVATALHRLTAEESWAAAIVAVLGARHWTDRMDAAIALARFAPTADLVHALGRAVCDSEYLVRYHAANTLLRYAQPPDDPEVDPPVSVYREPGLFELIATPRAEPRRRWRRRRDSPGDRARWQAAADELVGNALARLDDR